MGVPDHVLLWISGYLTCRSQRIVVNGATSQSMPLLSGVCKGQSLALSSSSYPSIALLLFQTLVIPKLLFMQITFSFTQFLSRISLQWDIMAIEWWVLNNHPTFNTANITIQCYLGRDWHLTI